MILGITFGGKTIFEEVFRRVYGDYPLLPLLGAETIAIFCFSLLFFWYITHQ